jgi:hypothetical protein
MNIFLFLIFPITFVNCHVKYQDADEARGNECDECSVVDGKELRCVARSTSRINSLEDLKLTCWIQTFTEIERITINGFNFAYIAEQYLFDFEMKNLTYLNLANNQIQTIKSKNFLENLPNLKQLVLDTNRLDLASSSHFLVDLSDTLELLSLNSAFNTMLYENENERSMRLSKTLREFLSESKLHKLTDLELRQNRLTEFNLNFTNLVNSYVLNQIYDVFCLLPSLKALYLNSNNLLNFDVNFNCISTNQTKVEFIDLEDNNMQALSMSFIQKLNLLKRASANFRINFKSNRFKCDVKLCPFFNWLLMTDSDDIIIEKNEISCFSIRKPIISVQMQQLCSAPLTAVSSETTSRRTTKAVRKSEKFTFNKLVVFLVVVLLVLVLFNTLRCLQKSILKSGKTSREYRSRGTSKPVRDSAEPTRTVDNQASTSQTFDLADQDVDLIDHSKQSRWFSFSFMRHFSRKKRLLSRHSLASFDYKHFDDNGNDELVMDRAIFTNKNTKIIVDNTGNIQREKYAILEELK